eukprot:1706651-Amphidinium_carterae.3
MVLGELLGFSLVFPIIVLLLAASSKDCRIILSRAAELGLAASYLKEWKILEETAKNESDGSTQPGGGSNPGGGCTDHKRRGGGNGDHTKGTPAGDGKTA